MRKILVLTATALALSCATTANAAIVDFEDLGVAPGTQLNTGNGVPQNSGGFTFTPGPNDTSGINDMHFHNMDGFGDNGGTNLGTHDDVVMTKVGGGVFSLSSFDFAGFGTETGVDLVGLLFGGGTLSTSFVADGVASSYQNFSLSGWNNLVSVTWTKPSDGGNGFFLDNINTGASGAVPEPASWAMMIAGFGLVGGSLRTRRTKVAARLA